MGECEGPQSYWHSGEAIQVFHGTIPFRRRLYAGVPRSMFRVPHFTLLRTEGGEKSEEHVICKSFTFKNSNSKEQLGDVSDGVYRSDLSEGISLLESGMGVLFHV